MTSMTRRRLLGAPIALTAVTLAACGGGGSDSSGTSNVRALNLMIDVPSIDIYADSTTRWFAADATDTLTSYLNIAVDTFSLDVRAAGSSTSLLSQDQGFGKDDHYTLIAWGRAGAPRLWKLEENLAPSDITDGKGRVRAFGATNDIGLLDVYLTTDAADLASSTPFLSSVGEGTATGYSVLASGTYRLRVTGTGAPDDLRLDVSGVTIKATDYTTIILTAGAGGVLVNASVLEQQGSLRTYRNTKARLRVVAGVADRAAVGMSWAGSTIAGSLVSPIVGPYAMVDAGSQTLDLRINGVAALSEARTLDAGGDYTVLALGPAATPAIALIADDNRLPTTSTRAKVRLVHGCSGLGALTLSIDYAVTASDVPVGTSSTFANLTASSAARIDVTAANSSDLVYTADDVNLQAKGVYTLFVLGGNTSATGVLRKDR